MTSTWHRLLASVAILAVIGGCVLAPTPVPPTPEPLPPLTVRVPTPDGFVGLYREAFRVHLVLGEFGGGSSTPFGEPPTVHLLTAGGMTEAAYNSFVYGEAPAGAATVELAGFETLGGQVVDGLYVLAIRDKDMNPALLRWTFRTAADVVLAVGTGITP